MTVKATPHHSTRANPEKNMGSGEVTISQEYFVYGKKK